MKIAKSTGLKHFGLERPFFSIRRPGWEHPDKRIICGSSQAFEQFKAETGSPVANWSLAGGRLAWRKEKPFMPRSTSRCSPATSGALVLFPRRICLCSIAPAEGICLPRRSYEGFGHAPRSQANGLVGCPGPLFHSWRTGRDRGPRPAVTINPEDVSALKTQLVAAGSGCRALREELRAKGLGTVRDNFHWQRNSVPDVGSLSVGGDPAENPDTPGSRTESHHSHPAAFQGRPR